jgi:hypothetical protein
LKPLTTLFSIIKSMNMLASQLCLAGLDRVSAAEELPGCGA